MKTRLLLFTALMASSLVLSVSSCKKDKEPEPVVEEPTPTPTPEPTPAPPSPTFASGDGTLAAIKSKSVSQTPVGPVTLEIGLASAAFYTAGNTSAFLDAGAVSANTKALTKQTNNSYVFTPTALETTGIDFGNNAAWSVGGGSSVPGFSHTTTMGFPGVTDVTSGGTVVRSSGYTLTISGLSNADSVIYMVGTVIKTLPGNVSSCAFTASELSGLSAGTSIVQAAAYKLQQATYNSKNYYFVNEAVVSKTVTIE